MDTEWLVIGGIVVVVLAIVFAVQNVRARKRTQALVAVANDLKFEFVGNKWADAAQAQSLKTALFRKGYARNFRNIMTGGSADLGVRLFDYSFVSGSGRESKNIQQTVAVFVKGDLALPDFELSPSGILQKIGGALLKNDIRFEAHPQFSQRYQVRGADEAAIRALFTPPMLAYFESIDPARKWHVEGVDQTVVLYRANKREDPTTLRVFLDDTGTVAGSLIGIVRADNAVR